jgi:hypothetical protein
MWKDWGFAATLFEQAKHFLSLAKQSGRSHEQEAYIRATIVFSLMSFEAFFFREIIAGYLEQNRATIDPDALRTVEVGLEKRTKIRDAVKDWPRLLTGRRLTASPDFQNFVKYRNALVHGKITEAIPSLGKLAQEVETIDNAELAIQTIGEMIRDIALHFNFAVPPWV